MVSSTIWVFSGVCPLLGALPTLFWIHVIAGAYILENTPTPWGGDISPCHLGKKYEKTKRKRGKMQKRKEERGKKIRRGEVRGQQNCEIVN
jgi:hypothetical protein